MRGAGRGARRQYRAQRRAGEVLRRACCWWTRWRTADGDGGGSGLDGRPGRRGLAREASKEGRKERGSGGLRASCCCWADLVRACLLQQAAPLCLPVASNSPDLAVLTARRLLPACSAVSSSPRSRGRSTSWLDDCGGASCLCCSGLQRRQRQPVRPYDDRSCPSGRAPSRSVSMSGVRVRAARRSSERG